jgi:hypothetical protein
MKLRRDAMSVEIPNQTNCAGMKWISTHTLATSRPRLPFRKLPSILETMSVEIPNQTNCAGMKWISTHTLEIAFIVFRPSESRVDHHSANGADGILMMAANAAVLDTLTFNQKLGAEFFWSMDAIIGAAILNGCANRGSFTLKLELGLNGFGSGEANLMNYWHLATSTITEESATSTLLRRERLTTSSEVATLEARRMLIRKHKISRVQLVQFEKTIRSSDSLDRTFRGTLLLAKLTRVAFGGLNGGRSHFNADGTNNASASEPLTMLKTKMAPLGVPSMQMLLVRGEVSIGGAGDSSKRMSSLHGIGEGTEHWKCGLMMASDSKIIPIFQAKHRAIPFEAVFAF